MDWLLLAKAAIMGIVEGLTEFFPISSTGHLIVVGDLINFDDRIGNVFEVVIQLGGGGVGSTNLVVTDETTANPSGLVYWPQVQLIVNSPGISAGTLDAWTNHGVILHNPGGYGPGTPWVPNFGQCLVNTNTFAALTNRLGVRFTGGDM